jgi:small basic protein
LKFWFALLLTLLFVALTIVIYIGHVWLVPVPVVLYSAITDALIAAAITIGTMIVLRRHLPFGGFEQLLLGTLWIVAGCSVAVTVPTVLDRSLSFYILEKLQQRGGGIRADRFEDVFVNEYMPEFRLIDVRLTEQLSSGTVTLEDGCVRLTPRGDALASLGRFFRTNLLPKRRLLMGEYSDALVDPFARSRQGRMGYEC